MKNTVLMENCEVSGRGLMIETHVSRHTPIGEKLNHNSPFSSNTSNLSLSSISSNLSGLSFSKTLQLNFEDKKEIGYLLKLYKYTALNVLSGGTGRN